MSGLETAGLALGAIGILFQTFEATYAAYRLVQGLHDHSERYSLVWTAFENQRTHFFLWGEKHGLTQTRFSRTDPTPERRMRDRYGAERCASITRTLAQMAKLFEEAKRTNNKYGLRKVRVQQKVVWTLHKEEEFAELVRRLREFNADLEKFTTVEVKALTVDTKIAGDDLRSTKRARFSAHDFESVLSECHYFGDRNIGLYLKLQANRFKLDDNPAQKLPEWLDFQIRQRRETVKFNITIVPSFSASSPTSISETPRKPVRLLFESSDSSDDCTFSDPTTKHIGRHLQRLTRCSSTCPLCTDLTTSTGLCLGGFRGIINEQNHTTYLLPPPRGGHILIPLHDLLPGGPYAHLLPAPNPAKRIRLVHLLALSFLQLLDTQWLPSHLSSSDVFFLVDPTSTLTPSITEAYILRTPPAHKKPHSRPPSAFSNYHPSRQNSGMSATSAKSAYSNSSRHSYISATSTGLYAEPEGECDFDEATFHLALVIYEILTWLPQKERAATTAAIKARRGQLYSHPNHPPPSYAESLPNTPSYQPTSHPAPAAQQRVESKVFDPREQFSAWLQKEGVLKQVKKVVRSERYIGAVRACFLGGFVRGGEEGVEIGETEFWEKVVVGLKGGV
ncbi:hypothetical protein BJ508DRAFT_412593 [Ascobolus immersus RN42]|uniref:Prion-inhibition and propagation HeLo domain-containing protein n=1 Tax=Ascobolus immersus RN42 TaxID=1160509 RepID=A0A3N4IEH9_ASCIM|nr:hypothetical protein BJ508DRAFT_412593 [Ascobolus immersus RN42]